MSDIQLNTTSVKDATRLERIGAHSHIRGLVSDFGNEKGKLTLLLRLRHGNEGCECAMRHALLESLLLDSHIH